MSAYGLTTSASANYNGLATSVQSDTSRVVWYGHVKDASGNIFASVKYNGSSNHLHEFKNMKWTGTVKTPLVLPQGTVSYQIGYCLGGGILDAAGNLSDQVRICLTRT